MDGVGVGVVAGVVGAEVPELRGEVVGRGDIDELPDERDDVDELPGPAREDVGCVRDGVGVFCAGAGVRVPIADRFVAVRVPGGVVTTATRPRAGGGAGRMSRYVTRVRRNMMLRTTVDVRARCWIRITACPLVARCRVRAAQ